MAFKKPDTAKSSYGVKELQRGKRDSIKRAKVAPTGIEGLDNLIFEPFSEKGGIPMGRGKITLLGGDPGSGKTRLGINLATQLLHDGNHFMYVGFEMEAGEFIGQVEQQYKHLYGKGCPVENIWYLDYYCTPFSGASGIKNIASRALEFKKQTESPFVFLDSITEMASMETLLRKIMDTINTSFFNTGEEFALIGVSQFRGSYDKGIAGGKGMSHKGTAVILLEAEEISNFNKKYMPQHYNMGDLIRTVRVIKTMNYSHPINKFVYTIDKHGVFQFTGETLSVLANKDVRE